MNLAELYHRMQTDLTMLVRQEDRKAFLSVFTAGFDEEGRTIPIEPHQQQLLKCLGCAYCNTTACKRCADFIIDECGDSGL